MKTQTLLTAAVLFSLFSCKSGNENNDYDRNALDSAALAAIDTESYKAHVEKLSSDEFEGRLPFTKGDTLTVNYIKDQFSSLGLEPGNGDSFFQEVPLVAISSSPSQTKLAFKGKEGEFVH